MRKKLLVVLGAGSSIDQGMPSVADLDGYMKIWSAEWLRSDPAIPPSMDNYFIELWKHAETYYAHPFLSYRVNLDFEKVLGDMLNLAHWIAPAPMGNPLRGIVCGDRVPEGLRYQFDRGREPFGAYHMVNSQFGYLLIQLARHVRKCCRRFDPGSRNFMPYRHLLNGLQRRFDVGIYNLNYDDIAAVAWPEASTGFDEVGRFDPSGVHERSEWNFIYHLHGSIHHTLKGTSIAPIYWQKDLDSDFKDGDEGQAIIKMSDGKSFPRSTLIAGGFKLDQLLIEPFQSFYAAFARHAHQADAVLIAGYGFSDTHVNRTLQNCLEDHVLRGSGGRPPVVVLTKSRDGERQMDTRQDNWAFSMRQTLLCPHGFQCETFDSPRSDNLIPSRSFETSAVAKVGVWHDGFCEAAGHLDKIIGFLDDAKHG